MLQAPEERLAISQVVNAELNRYVQGMNGV